MGTKTVNIKGNGRDLIREYILSYPSLNNTALARLLLKHHPVIFTNIENTRIEIRKVRKTDKKYERNPNAHTPFNLPEPSYAQEVETYFLDYEQHNKILLISDLHVPYYDHKALAIALEYGKSQGINTVLILGDLLDFYSISRFLTNPGLRDIVFELEVAREVLESIRDAFPDAKIIFKKGNHELWWEKYLWTNAPAFSQIQGFDIGSVLDLDDLDIELVHDKSDIRLCENLSAIHGHEVYGGTPAKPAEGFYRRWKGNVIGAHHHKPQNFSTKTGVGTVISTWSLGCLCLLRPEYNPFNEWINGFAEVDIYSAKHFNVQNLKIIDGYLVNA